MPHHHHSLPDYVPSVFSFGRQKQEQEDSTIERFERRIQRMAECSDQREKGVKGQEKEVATEKLI